MVMVAQWRAAHLHLFDGPKIHEDEFALQLGGLEDAETLRALYRNNPDFESMAACFAMRQRFSEDREMAALARGVDQIVLLGAGLDSFALRHPEIPRRTLYVEVDLPASQAWKHARMAKLGLETPDVRYLGVDFAKGDLSEKLVAAGVDPARPTFFAWLGVSYYLTRAQISATLSLVARHAPGSEIVFDVMPPHATMSEMDRVFALAAAGVAAQAGEPWRSFADPAALSRVLKQLGFSETFHLTPKLAAERYYRGQKVPPSTRLQMMAARV